MSELGTGTSQIISPCGPIGAGVAPEEARLSQVTERVFVARGYSLSNIIYVRGESGVVAIDTGESVSAARKSLEDFRRHCSNLPITTIVYTHSHGDHIRGANALRSAATRIIAHRSMTEELARIHRLLPYRIRIDRLQFGLGLDESERAISHVSRGDSGYVAPDITFESEYRSTEGGVRFELYHAPGESVDHVMIWLPDEEVLCPGDNFYYSFPMLSNPMKPDRPVLEWANSLARMRALQPKYLVPSHGPVLTGAEAIDATLANYEEAIRYLHDRTVDLINRGFSLPQIRQRVRLPVELRSLDYLQPRYGSVDWAVCGIYRQYTGWYDLNPSHLNPPAPRVLNDALLAASGGVKPLLKRARKTVNEGRERLCLELTDIVLAARPSHRAALTLRERALQRLGKNGVNRVEQNLYRSAALAVREHMKSAATKSSAAPRSRAAAHRCKPPVFILAAPRSYTSIVCAMLGQHPDMYGMPELHLFKCATMAEWFELCRQETFPRAHGMRRAVAELFFGGQTERTISAARTWLLARLHLRTGQVFRELGAKVFPKIIVEKSPSINFDLEALTRAYSMFPNARFIHLVRHPHGQGESVLKFIKVRSSHGSIPPGHWLLRLSEHNSAAGGVAVPDPQHAWRALNQSICHFLDAVPDAQKRTVRGEELLSEPQRAFEPVLQWLGLPSNPAAIEAMTRPELSPYAFLGPRGAEFGNDRLFLQDPVFKQRPAASHDLHGPTAWGPEGNTLTAEVIELAASFGYK